MGTIAEKGVYLNTTKSLLKQKINNLGGSIDDNTTFRNYANQLQNVYDNLPKTSYQTGTEVTLSNCLKGKLDFEEDNGKKVVGIGQSSQDSTKGYQLFDINGNRTDTNCTSSVVGNELHQNNLTNYCRTAWKIENLVVGNSYTISTSYSNPDNCSVQVRLMDSNNSNVLEQTQARTLASGDFQLTFTATETTHYIRFYSNTLSSTNTNEVTFYEIMLEQGTTAHDWEKYTGGQASPNPNYPQTINSVTGNQDVVVSGKNLAEGLELGEINAQTGDESQTNNIVRLKNYIPYSKLKSYRQSVNGENLSSSTGLRFYNKDKVYIGYANFSTTASIQDVSITIGSGVTTTDLEPKYFRIRVGTSVLQTDSKYMIATSNDLTYEPYITPTSYQLSLGDIELNAIGDYKDELIYDVDNDKVYKNKAIGKYQFTGNENFGKAASTNLNGYIFNFPSVTTNILAPANNGIKANILSNAFITKAVDTIISEATYGIGIRSDKYLYIGAPLGSFENVSALQTYLANNITFMYYVLATAVKEEITGTLKDQIKALYNAHSNNGTTILTSNGDLPLVLKVRGLKGE